MYITFVYCAEQIRTDLEKFLAHELPSLDKDALRERLVKMVLEIQERNQTETARLMEILTESEKEHKET
jgi:hypothetical protein